MVYHVNPDTGDSGVCRAEKGGCPWDKEKVGANHYETAAEAQSEGTKILVSEFGSLSTVAKSKGAADETVEDTVEKANGLRGALRYAPVGSRIKLLEVNETELTVQRNASGELLLIDDEGYDRAKFLGNLNKLSYDLVSGSDSEEARNHLKLGVLGRERKILDTKMTEDTRNIQKTLGYKSVSVRVIGKNVLFDNPEPYIHIYFDNTRKYDYSGGESFSGSIVKDSNGEIEIKNKEGGAYGKVFEKVEKNSKKLAKLDIDQIFKNSEDFTSKAKEFNDLEDELYWEATGEQMLKVDETDPKYKGIVGSLPMVDETRVRINGEELRVTDTLEGGRPLLYNKYGERKYDEIAKHPTAEYTYDLISGPDNKEFWDEMLKIRHSR